MNEIDLPGGVWRKSSFSSGNGQCTEVAFINGHVALRDSKNSTGPVLMFKPGEWDVFLSEVQDGEFKQP